MRHQLFAGTAFSGGALQQSILDGLAIFNADPDILYMAELRQRSGADAIDKDISKTVSKSGFTRTSPDEYEYKGSNPAKALEKLSKVRPLVLDCATSLHLLTFQALLKQLGETQFDAYIKDACDGVLSIHKQKAPPVPADSTAFYCARHEQQENLLPDDLQTGDRLWIQGPANGFAFHPASEANAFNVMVETHEHEIPSLTGFVSTATTTHGCWKYDGLRDMLLKSYNAPLTLRDVSILAEHFGQDRQEAAPYSALTYKNAYVWLRHTQPEALTQALQKLNSKKRVDLDQPTTLLPPKAEAIRGVAQHTRLQEKLSLHALENHPGSLSTVALNPVLSHVETSDNLIPGFEIHLPHQQQIYAAVQSFYNACINPALGESGHFNSAILYGNAGTGKTMACKAVLQRLAEEGKTVWETDFNEGENESLVSYPEREQLLLLWQTKGRKAMEAALLEKLRPKWDKADILFIDDTNNSHDILSDVSNLALRYARQTGKKILITCNSDPIKAFHSSIEFPIDFISIRHINGPDHRAAKAWHHQAALQNYVPPSTIYDGKKEVAATGNQQLTQQWLQSLHDTPGHNGVAFYGPPGMGKTTALKDYFATNALTAFWIESHTLTEKIDVLHELANSEAEYLVIDDCNDPKGDFNYQKILFDLLNNETLYNRNNQPVRVVLVSNRASWQELVDDTSSGSQALSPRMNSRYNGRFKSIELVPDQDFRAEGAKRGTIAKAGTVAVPTDAYQLSISQFVAERTEKQKISNYYMAMSNAGGGYEIALPPAVQAKQDAAWRAFQNVEKNALQNITKSEQILVDMSGCENDDPRSYLPYKELIKQVLDVMEAKPDYQVKIVSEDPRKTRALLENLMAGVDKTGKYTSRLQRLAQQVL